MKFDLKIEDGHIRFCLEKEDVVASTLMSLKDAMDESVIERALDDLKEQFHEAYKAFHIDGIARFFENNMGNIKSHAKKALLGNGE